MRGLILGAVLACLCLGQVRLHAQDLSLYGHKVEIHGFVSQGFVYTDTNNWLTMNSSSGSGAYTDFGVNISMQVTHKVRVGAQFYDRNLGKLGRYDPVLDWAVADYRFQPWLGVRAGKVKTTLGLYNETQDLDFLYTFALLPQSVYPTDVRDATLAHTGGDVYGRVPLRRQLGALSYTAFVGHRSDNIHSGYGYLASQYGFRYSSYTALQVGVDLRWQTPLKGLLIGASRLDQSPTGKGTVPNPFNPGGGLVAVTERARASWTNQYYAEYAVGKLRIDSEYRRLVNAEDDIVSGEVVLNLQSDVRGWYVSGSYQVHKRFALGSYYSLYTITHVASGPLAGSFPDQTDTSLPGNHVYDRAITGRFDLNRFLYIKVEGHFMNGNASTVYPDGFYPQVNPQGFQDNTKALVIKTGINF